MLRTEIKAAAHRILAALDVSGVQDVLRQAGHPPSERVDAHSVLRSFQIFQREAMRFSATDIELMKIMKIDNLIDPEWWSTLLAENRNSALSEIWPIISRIEFCRENLPSIIKLLERNAEHVETYPERELEKTETLSVILDEEKGTLSNPERLIKILQSIQDLYEAYARLNKESQNGLSVLSMDSSGLSVTFDARAWRRR